MVSVCETYAGARVGATGGLRGSGGWLRVGGTASRSNRDVRGSGAVVTLGRDDLIVMRSQCHSKGSPCLKVSTDIDGSARAVTGTNGPVLLEGRRSLNGRLIGAGRLEDLVGAAVHSDGTLRACGRRGIVVTEAFDDVVLNQGVLGPAVDG